MKQAIFLAGILTAIAVLPGCGGGPQNEVERLVDALVDRYGAFDQEVAKELQLHGEEAIEALLRATVERPKHFQYAYAHVLVRIDSEPARFEACKILLEHEMTDVRRRAVEGLAEPGSPREAVELAMKLAVEHEDPAVRSAAHRTISFYNDPVLFEPISRTLRRGLNDPDQSVREHAQLAIDRMREAGNFR